MSIHYLLGSKIKYEPLEEDNKKIAELVKKQRFRTPEAFIDRAIQVLLTWELDPKSSIDIMKGYPQTEEQKQLLQQLLQPQIYQENFQPKISAQTIEQTRLAEKLKSNDDFEKLKSRISETKQFIKNLKITVPENQINYDNYPILFRFYTRFTPAKIVLSVLADLLYQNPNSNRVNLEILRADALDIATEVSNEIIKFEEINKTKRNKKTSTGFPKETDDQEQQVSIQKRFRDQYVGKIRKGRKKAGNESEEFFDGILAALDLVYINKEEGKTFVSLTQRGKEFYLLDNPILKGDYSQGLSEKESNYIFDTLIPKLTLEKEFWDSALQVIKIIQDNPELESKTRELLDESIIKSYEIWIKKNSTEAKKLKFNSIDYVSNKETKQKEMEGTWAKYIEGWRVAVMGRLAELNKVEWHIQSETGKSIFKLK